MNTLGRDIKMGEVVVIRSRLSIQARTFVCEDGFGMTNITAGSTIFGRWLNTGEKARISGTDIDRRETLKYQRENPQ